MSTNSDSWFGIASNEVFFEEFQTFKLQAPHVENGVCYMPLYTVNPCDYHTCAKYQYPKQCQEHYRLAAIRQTLVEEICSMCHFLFQADLELIE